MPVVNGTTYHSETPQRVIDVLESVRQSNREKRIRIYLGDTKTGRSWLEEHDVEGYVGRSTGTSKVPLLIHNRRSMGGPALLDHCIVRITTSRGGYVLYSHDKFHTPELTYRPSEMEGYVTEVLADGEVHARFKGHQQAMRWLKKMRGW